jgi:hypothetical protein
MSWFAEAVLIVRVAAVFPRSQLPLLLAFPLAIKVARFVVNVLFSVQWAKRLSGAGSQLVILQTLPRTFFKASFILELIDNRYAPSYCYCHISVLTSWTSSMELHLLPLLMEALHP